MLRQLKPVSAIWILIWVTVSFSSAASNGVPDSLTPNPRLVSYPWMSLSTWYAMHAEDVEQATQGQSALVFIGDSITQGWNGAGQKQWDTSFATRGAVNFGIGGDMTQNLLWRLNFGAKENLDPKAVVLLIGTNNFAFTKDAPETIAAGVIAVVDTLAESYPRADILLMGIFPRSESPDAPARTSIARVNRIISQLQSRERVTYLDIGDKLLEPDGRISKKVMPDFLHLSDEGYRRWAEAILPWIAERVP